MNKNRKNIENEYQENFHNGNKIFFLLKYDKLFAIIELIMSFLIIIVSIAMIFFSFERSFEDPIKYVKNNFLCFQLICLIGTSIIAGIMSFWAKKAEVLKRGLILVGLLSTVIIILQVGIKLFIDNIYQEETFESFYNTYKEEINSNNNSEEIVIGLSGIKVLEAKQAYIEKSMNAYMNFKIKTMILLIIYFLLIISLFYLVYRIDVKERKKAKILQNDNILFGKAKEQ